MVEYLERRKTPYGTYKIHRSDLSKEDFDDAVLACTKSAIRPSIQKIRHIKVLSAELMQLLYETNSKVSVRFTDKLSMLAILSDEVNSDIKAYFAEEESPHG